MNRHLNEVDASCHELFERVSLLMLDVTDRQPRGQVLARIRWVLESATSLHQAINEMTDDQYQEPPLRPLACGACQACLLKARCEVTGDLKKAG